MSAPRLEIDLDKIYHNAHTLVERLGRCGISVTGVTKALLGSVELASTLVRAGVRGLGDSRIENIEAMRSAQVPAQMTLIRSPMLSQVDRVVHAADISFNTERVVLKALSQAAHNADCIHGIVLMVELGDLREGLLPKDLLPTVREVLRLPNLLFKGIGTNLACRSGVMPDTRNMNRLSTLAASIETTLEVPVEIVSGGNSANLDWALSGAKIGWVNHLRLGEAILLGCEPLHRRPITGLHTDAFTLVAEVIESKKKPSLPTGKIAQAAFGSAPKATDRGAVRQSILAIGQQDTDPAGLQGPEGIAIQGGSSDHLIVESDTKPLAVGTEVPFQLNYSALVRSMTSPHVTKSWDIIVRHSLPSRQHVG